MTTATVQPLTPSFNPPEAAPLVAIAIPIEALEAFAAMARLPSEAASHFFEVAQAGVTQWRPLREPRRFTETVDRAQITVRGFYVLTKRDRADRPEEYAKAHPMKRKDALEAEVTRLGGWLTRDRRTGAYTLDVPEGPAAWRLLRALFADARIADGKAGKTVLVNGYKISTADQIGGVAYPERQLRALREKVVRTRWRRRNEAWATVEADRAYLAERHAIADRFAACADRFAAMLQPPTPPTPPVEAFDPKRERERITEKCFQLAAELPKFKVNAWIDALGYTPDGYNTLQLVEACEARSLAPDLLRDLYAERIARVGETEEEDNRTVQALTDYMRRAIESAEDIASALVIAAGILAGAWRSAKEGRPMSEAIEEALEAIEAARRTEREYGDDPHTCQPRSEVRDLLCDAKRVEALEDLEAGPDKEAAAVYRAALEVSRTGCGATYRVATRPDTCLPEEEEAGWLLGTATDDPRCVWIGWDSGVKTSLEPEFITMVKGEG